jgi:fused signal recognition particle receptor
MFSFFKKKPPAAQTPAGAAEADVESAPASSGQAPAISSTRPRTALEWLNADVGELFFGKKPVEAPAVSPPATVPPAPAGVAPAETSQVVPPAVPPVSAPAEPEPEDRRDWLAKLRTGLRKTGSTIAQALAGASIDDAMYEDLEAALLQADAGVAATRHLLDDLQRRIRRAHLEDPAAVRGLLADCVADLLAPLERPLMIGEHMPTVIMVVGVNGAGKTTSVGKLARHLVDADQKVLLAAADTFRAAAREQLLAWAERAEPTRDGTPAAARLPAGNRIEIVSQEGGDPAGLTFDAVVAGRARGCDVVIADTAGRLATQAHLMEELKKIRRTIAKAEPGAPHEVLLVIDGNTGQNALAQVQAFDAALELTGLIITKLDGTAKGGVLAAIALWSRARAAPLPVYFIGVGEKLADLQTFRAREFAQALLS